jgi:2,5-diamino-6-(ribosylamino)-4(3H)-pyrimidinone 5'-phosphate reductase
MPRPHVIINAAMTLDGKIDSVARRGAAISSPQDMARMDRLRRDADAILVGGHTLLENDPKLTIKTPHLRAGRLAAGLPENPAKIGVITRADLSPDCQFIMHGPARRLIYTTSQTSQAQISSLQAAGAEIHVMGETRVPLPEVLASLHALGFRRLMVEGGGTLIAGLLRLNLVDELIVYIAPQIFGGVAAPTLVDGDGFLPENAPRLQLLSVEKFDEQGGILVHYTLENAG